MLTKLLARSGDLFGLVDVADQFMHQCAWHCSGELTLPDGDIKALLPWLL
jgi:hypothetical protein